MGWVMCSTDDHASALNSGQIHYVKYPKRKYYKDGYTIEVHVWKHTECEKIMPKNV